MSASHPDQQCEDMALMPFNRNPQGVCGRRHEFRPTGSAAVLAITNFPQPARI
jgi:hypothetical protein